MPELVHQFSAPFVRADREYRVAAWGGQRSDGRWDAWLVFVPLHGAGARVTGLETSQNSRRGLMSWAGGLTAVDLNGAFERTVPAADHVGVAPGHSVLGAPESPALLESDGTQSAA
jgi:hypothetical protein